MTPALWIAAAWAVFTGSHILLSTDPLRARLVQRFGERGFVNAFSAVAVVALGILMASAAFLRDQGAAGPALGGVPLVRTVAIAAIGFGFAMSTASLVAYRRSPMALFSSRVREPRGIERITRHAFFVGLAIAFGAHIVLAPTLAAAVFFAGFVFHAVLGSWMQDRKLAARLGEPYRNYMAATSTLPFAAILAGRQQLALREQPWVPFAAGILAAWGIRVIHDHLFDYAGLGIVAATLAGAIFATVAAEREARMQKQRDRMEPA